MVTSIAARAEIRALVVIYCASQRVPPSWKARAGVNLVRLSMFAGYLVLLAGDVSSNPGPSI